MSEYPEQLARLAKRIADEAGAPPGFRVVVVVADANGAFVGVGYNTTAQDCVRLLRCAYHADGRVDYPLHPICPKCGKPETSTPQEERGADLCWCPPGDTP